jgi:hypothetical protein
VTVKWCGQFHETKIGHSPLDVVAWHGNYAPLKYDLRTYCPVGAILFDHPDPSIFTVLTAPSGVPGTANIDFVLFRERWMVAEDTFRPPWYHKNIMSELMGNIYGQYDAKPQGFVPGRYEPAQHDAAARAGPRRLRGGLERQSGPTSSTTPCPSCSRPAFPQHLTSFAAKEAPLQDDYIDCWAASRRNSTARRDLVEIHLLAEGEVPLEESGLALKALRVDHPPVVDCFALRFDTKDWSVVFSADTAFFPPLAVFAKDCDVLVHEAMLQRGVDKIVEITGNGDRLRAHLWASHTMAPDAAKIAEMAQAKTLLLNHLIPADLPGFEEQEWLEATETFSGQTIVGHDGLVIIK